MKYKDYYKILGVSRDASQDDIRKAYRRLARKYHPDVSKEPNAEQRFKEINEANEALKDPQRRATYDSLGNGWTSAPHRAAAAVSTRSFASRTTAAAASAIFSPACSATWEELGADPAVVSAAAAATRPPESVSAWRRPTPAPAGAYTWTCRNRTPADASTAGHAPSIYASLPASATDRRSDWQARASPA